MKKILFSAVITAACLSLAVAESRPMTPEEKEAWKRSREGGGASCRPATPEQVDAVKATMAKGGYAWVGKSDSHSELAKLQRELQKTPAGQTGGRALLESQIASVKAEIAKKGGMPAAGKTAARSSSGGKKPLTIILAPEPGAAVEPKPEKP